MGLVDVDSATAAENRDVPVLAWQDRMVNEECRIAWRELGPKSVLDCKPVLSRLENRAFREPSRRENLKWI